MRAASIHLVNYFILLIVTFSSISAKKVPEESLRVDLNWYNQIISQSCGGSASCSKKGGFCINSSHTCNGRLTDDCIGNDCMCCIPQCACDDACEASRSCTQQGGTCLTKDQTCYGTINPRLCNGRSCKCCIQVATTTPAPTTTPPAPTTTPLAPTTTPSLPNNPPASTTTPPAPTTTPPAPPTIPPAPTTTPPAPTTTPPAPSTIPPAPTTAPPAPTTTPIPPTHITIKPVEPSTTPEETCEASQSCKQKGGTCITENQECFGTPKPRLCKGSTCTCCVPLSQSPSTTLAPTTPPAACNYDGVAYNDGDIIYIGCAQLRCENNALVPTFEVNSDCKLCQVYNDPHFRTFDNEKYNWHQRCNFSLVQNTQDDNPDYAVYGDFRDCTPGKYKKGWPACVKHTVIMDHQHNTFRFNHLNLRYITVNGVKQKLPNDDSVAQFDSTLVWKNKDQTRILMGDDLYVGITEGKINIWSQPSLTDSLYGMCRFKGGLSNGHYGGVLKSSSRKDKNYDNKKIEDFALSWRTLTQENKICLQRQSPAAAEQDLCIGKNKSTLKKFLEKCTASIDQAAPRLHEDTKNIKIDSCIQDLCVCKDTEACLEDIGVMAENDQSIQDHVFDHPPKVECGSQFINIDDECIYISKGIQQVSWEVAKTECSNMGAELIAPVSNEFMKQQQSNYGTFWVGGRYYDSKSSYSWVMGGKITSGWQTGYPDKSNDGRCVAFKYYGSHNRGFIDDSCDESRRYICKEKKNK